MAGSVSRASLWLAISQISSEGMVLLRNVFLARLLGPSEMGVVVTLAVTLRMLEMTTDLAVDRLMIQSKDGSRRRFQANAQGFFLVRGVVAGAILAMLAVPLAALFGLSQSTWAFAALGLVPVARGFAHLDSVRAQREMAFRGSAAIEIISNVIATLACFPLALLVGDASTIVWVNLVRACSIVVMSHAVAERPYEIRLESGMVRRFTSFGWPLIVDGWVLFAMFHGDRIAIAFTSTMEELGRCAIALQLAMVASLVLARSSISLWLPLLSRSQHREHEFGRQYEVALKVLSYVSLAFIVGFMAAGNVVIEGLYGARFRVSASLVGWLAVMHGVRVLRTMPSIASMARGDSQTPMIANLVRLSGVIGSVPAGLCGLGLEGIVAAGCAGEVVAGLTSFALLQRWHRISLARSLPPILLVLAGAGAGAVLFLWLDISTMAKLGIAAVIEVVLGFGAYRTLVDAGLVRPPLPVGENHTPMTAGPARGSVRVEPT